MSFVQGHEVPVSPGHEAGLLVTKLHTKGVGAQQSSPPPDLAHLILRVELEKGRQIRWQTRDRRRKRKVRFAEKLTRCDDVCS